jgi:starvation-inducible DNA-binding protein
MSKSASLSSHQPVVDQLNQVLATTYGLAVKTHAAHWNVTGPQFFSLHAAFSEQYEALLEAADAVAERLRMLGAAAPMGIEAMAQRSGIKDLADHDGVAIAAALSADHRALSKVVSAAIKIAQEHADEATADLLIGRVEAHDKAAWMLAAVTG